MIFVFLNLFKNDNMGNVSSLNAYHSERGTRGI